MIAKQVKGVVGDLIKQKDQNGKAKELTKILELDDRLDREVKNLSGGELQRFAILIASITTAEILMFDEPSSYLDVRQRITASRVIREQVLNDTKKNYVIVVEHDLSILDYLSDYVCCLYGEQSVYGIVTMPYSVREGINIFLAGFIPTENMRFRDYELNFKVSQDTDEFDQKVLHTFKYPAMVKTFSKDDKVQFKLTIEPGTFNNSQITVLVGENGTGKTTFIKMLAGKDKEFKDKVPELNVSYKPQILEAKYGGSVQDLLIERLKDNWRHPQFKSDVTNPMKLEDILENNVTELSGGELQRVAMILVLGKPADIYLIDEPSAYLDSEQRIVCARCIKRFILNSKKVGFIVEHDFIMATYLADQVVVFEGIPGVDAKANKP